MMLMKSDVLDLLNYDLTKFRLMSRVYQSRLSPLPLEDHCPSCAHGEYSEYPASMLVPRPDY